MKLQKEQVSITHHAWLSYPPPTHILRHSSTPPYLQENNPVKPLGRLNPPPAKLKIINSKL
jgi:hypothetical protein